MPQDRTRAIDSSLLAIDGEDRVRLARLILAMRTRGARDTALLSAIEQVPRRLFLPATDRNRVFDDRPAAIECGQTAMAPSDLALMLSALGVQQENIVLEVGTGSGYATAVLARLAGRVISLERYRTLVELAQERFAALRLLNVSVFHADGLEGHPRGAPFDRILLGGSVKQVPDRLIEQLAPGGILVGPIGEPGTRQEILKIVRTDRGTRSERIGHTRVVPLMPGKALAL
jgi:protein-L-isoaspartate(D-aspartate) O-methyltransferase